MDAVITYVNGMEPIWRLQYNLHSNGKCFRHNKFTDYGTLRFVLRGISEHMKFIDRVFLVVSNIEQVPDYVNDNVVIITHDMFIPKEYLPTFNSNTIECFLWNIPDLSEEFIYFNDDMIPVNKMEKEDFFMDGLPCLKFNKHKTHSFGFNNLIRFSSYWASVICKINDGVEYLWTQHTMTPFLRSKYFEAYNKNEDVIKYTISNIRSDWQATQYYFSNFLFYSNSFVDKSITYNYIKTNISVETFTEEINNSVNLQAICINDYGILKGHSLKESVQVVNDELNKLLPNNGIYEK